jgi:hypothetical protein
MRIEEMLRHGLGKKKGYDPTTWLMMRLTEYEREGLIARYPDGRYGPARV